MEEEYAVDPKTHAAMLAVIRRRKWYLWGLILVYLPATYTSLKVTQSFSTTCAVFGVWFVLLCAAVTLMALSKCPRCGQTFHMRNSTLSFSGKCRHCGLPA